MAETLAGLLGGTRPDSQVLFVACLSAPQVRSLGDFRADVALARGALASSPAGPVALFHSDIYAFAVWLFASWHEARCVLVCAERAPTTEAHYLRVGECAVADLSNWDAATARPDFAPLPARLLALQIQTSGSTGAPTRIDKYLQQLDSEAAALEQCFGQLAVDCRIAGTVSHQHMYGLSFRLLWPLLSGRTVDCTPLQYPAQLHALNACSVLIASPAFLSRLGQTRAALAAVFSSGAALPASAGEAVAAQLGVRPLEIYGSSETGAIAWRQYPELLWQCLPGVHVRLSPEQLVEVQSDFLKDQSWYRSMDRAQLHDTGFQLDGRCDRIVKVEEKRVSLDGLEAALCAHAWVNQARVLLLTGTRHELAAVLVLSEAGCAQYRAFGKLALTRELRRALAAQSAAMPRRWRLVNALPQNAMAKVLHSEMAKLFEQRPQIPLLLETERHANEVRLVLEISPELAAFEGHFPQMAILPGVVMLDWAMHFARGFWQLPPHFIGMSQIKFHHTVQPDMQLSVRLQWLDAGSHAGQLQFHYSSKHGTHASGRIKLGFT